MTKLWKWRLYYWLPVHRGGECSGEEGRYIYEGGAWRGLFMVMEHFCVFILVVVTKIYTLEKTAQNYEIICVRVCTHRHTLKWVNVKNDKTWIKFVVQLPVLHKCQFSNFYIEQWSYRWHHLRTLSEGHLDFMYDLVSL